MKNEKALTLRRCTAKDLDAVMELQKKISEGMEEKDWFAETSRDDNSVFFECPNVVLGVYDDTRLVAYGSLGIFEEHSENLGWELGWNVDKVRACVNLDTIVVDSEFRGMGLQRKLIKECVEYARKVKSEGIVLTTICPANIYSLRNAQKEGFEVLIQKEMYGGMDRYILGKAL